MDRARQVLKDVFGFPDFRLSQAAAIAQLIEKNDNALVVYPTGGGKSLVYQVPALCLDSGITLVISPLISLMKDQVRVFIRVSIALCVLTGPGRCARAAQRQGSKPR